MPLWVSCGFLVCLQLLAFGRLVLVLVGLVGLVALWLRTVKTLEKPEVLGPNLAKTMCFSAILSRPIIRKRLKLEKPYVSARLTSKCYQNLVFFFDFVASQATFPYPRPWRGPGSSACGSLVGLLLSLAL